MPPVGSNRHRNHLNAILSSLVDALTVVDRAADYPCQSAAVDLFGISPTAAAYLLSIRNYIWSSCFSGYVTRRLPSRKSALC